jgi:hypothetical protein
MADDHYEYGGFFAQQWKTRDQRPATSKMKQRNPNAPTRIADDLDGLVVAQLIPERTLTPAELLACAVLENAVHDYRLWASMIDVEGRTKKRVIKEYMQVRDWFLSTSRAWLYDFESVCDILSLDPKSIRKRILST